MASALKEHTCTNNIAGIKRQNGNIDMTTEAIAAHFHEFYTKLYNLPPQHRLQGMEGDRTQIIQEYLTKSGLPTLQDMESSLLETSITPLGIKQAIKQLKGNPAFPTGTHTAIFQPLQQNTLLLAGDCYTGGAKSSTGPH